MLKTLAIRLILAYFRFLARLQLRKNPRAVIIGITGSSGKTSTRLAIVHILKTRGKVKHSAHANSESGIPLNILGLTPASYSVLDWLRLILLAPFMLLFNWEHFDYYVVEMGIDSPDAPKNMGYLLSIVRPEIGVVLNAGLTHAANFDYLVKDRDVRRREQKIRALIAKEKMQLAVNLPERGVAVINLDQRELAKLIRQIPGRSITYGKSSRADLQIHNDHSFLYQGHLYPFKLNPYLGDIYLSTFAAAVAACAALGVSPATSTALLSSYTPPAGRLRVFPGLSKSTIVDSSYNASPDSMLAALEQFKKLAGRAKKIAVLGDMRELGKSTKAVHKQLADWIPRYTEEVVLFGDSMLAHTYPVLKSRGFPVHHFAKMSELVSYLRKTIAEGDWILVKGSQNTILLERAVEGILADPQDVKHLCRRGRYWDKIRASTP